MERGEAKIRGVGRRDVAMSPGGRKCRSKAHAAVQNWRGGQQIWNISIYKPREKPWCNRRFYKLYSNVTNILLSQRSLFRSYKVSSLTGRSAACVGQPVPQLSSGLVVQDAP